jgi:hypothetical protein
MIALLEKLVDAFLYLPEYVEAGIVDLLNGVVALFEVVVDGVLSLLPALPAIVTPPESVAMANSILPVGFVVSVATPLLTVFVLWLGSSWILRKAGVIS